MKLKNKDLREQLDERLEKMSKELIPEILALEDQIYELQEKLRFLEQRDEKRLKLIRFVERAKGEIPRERVFAKPKNVASFVEAMRVSVEDVDQLEREYGTIYGWKRN